MDHMKLLKEVTSRKNLEKAFNFAVFDRRRNDLYHDLFELDYAGKEKKNIIDELSEELKNIDNYSPRPAYAFFPSKNNLCFRRMIYIPLKDLITIYAIISILAKYLDYDLSEKCFAARYARNKNSRSLLESFAERSWPKFCKWQKDCVKKYNILLRTDISSFFDSISHSELINKLAKQLSIDTDSPLLRLFRKITEIPVISYSNLKGKVEEPKILKQGLPIGNTINGFLANLYLKDIDDSIHSLEGIEYGRYIDDMRIFGKDKKSVLDALLILQQQLLSIGLNLNTSKTEIAESEEEIELIRSKLFEVSGSMEEYIDKAEGKTLLNDMIDLELDEFDPEFKLENPITSSEEAKLYCKLLGKKYPVDQRKSDQMEKLGTILTSWQSSGKHAAWLLMDSLFNSKPETRKKATEIFLELMNSDKTVPYVKYRLLHNFISINKRKSSKKKTDSENDVIDNAIDDAKEKLIEKVPDFLKIPAFEINITALYFLKSVGKSKNEIIEYIDKYCIKPLGEPIKNVILYLPDDDDTEFSTTLKNDDIGSPMILDYEDIDPSTINVEILNLRLGHSSND